MIIDYQYKNAYRNIQIRQWSKIANNPPTHIHKVSVKREIISFPGFYIVPTCDIILGMSDGIWQKVVVLILWEEELLEDASKVTKTHSTEEKLEQAQVTWNNCCTNCAERTNSRI